MHYPQNHLQQMGRLTKDPQISYTQNGKKRAWFGIAIDMGKTQSGEEVTEFSDWTVWETTADFAERYLHKGDLIYIEGRVRANKYTDAMTGQSVKRDEHIGDTIRILSRPNGNSFGGERSNLYEQNASQNAQNQPREEAAQSSWNDNGFGNPFGIDSSDLPF